MQIPKEFKQALALAYTNSAYIEQLFKTQKSFLMRLVNHANRYRTSGIYDEEDLFQEACFWTIECMWQWNESKGRNLSEYVVYNVGVRLANIIRSENTKKKKSDSLPLVIVYKEHSRDCIRGEIYESTIMNANNINQEELLQLKQTYENVKSSISDISKYLLDYLILCNGNVRDACRALKSSGKVRFGHPITDEAFRQRMMKKISSEILPSFRAAI